MGSTKKSKRKLKKYMETNKNENIMVQNLWDAAKAILKGKFIAKRAYLKMHEKSQIKNLTLHLKELKQKNKQNPKSVEGRK